MNLRFGLLLFCALAAARAEEIVFFEASSAGQSAWTWSSARVSDKGEGGLVIKESSPTNTAGDAFVTERFPYVPSARVVLDVPEVLKGDYTLQVLAFRNNAHVQTVTVVNHDTRAGRHDFAMMTLDLPASTDAVLFKIWVSGAESASVVIRELRYSAELDADKAVMDERFQDPSSWIAESDKVSLACVAGEPATLTLLPSAAYGSIASAASFSAKEEGNLLLRVSSSEGGAVVTLQLEAFDEAGAFAGAVDVIKDVPRGYHLARLANVEWPRGAERFRPKIWISGKDGASVSLDRLLLYRE